MEGIQSIQSPQTDRKDFSYKEDLQVSINPNHYLSSFHNDVLQLFDDFIKIQDPKRKQRFQIRIFFLTYFTFSVLHFTRESWAILKHKIQVDEGISYTSLGTIDTVFLSFYSFGLFISGSLGDHYSPKMLIIIAYICVTLVITFLSIGASAGWSSVVYFCFLFAINGTLQSVGWPSCTAIFANWFGKRGRGAIIGLWSSSGSFGNVGGALLTSFLTSTVLLSWEMTFLFIGQLCLLFALLNIFFLVVHPEEKGIVIQEIDEKLIQHEQLLVEQEVPSSIMTESSIRNYDTVPLDTANETKKGINFWNAWKIPGVLQYSLSYFCIKFSGYGLMLWLPLYLQKINGFSDYETSSCTSTLDVGYVIGGVLIGYLTDLTYSRRTPILVVSIILATLFQVLMICIDPNNRIFFFFYIFLLGILMGGAVAIVSGVACADLGKLKELGSNEKSMSTVTGIIDGTGSLGAAFGQLVIGICTEQFGWNSVFVIMSIMIFLSAVPLSNSVKKEFKEIMAIYRINQDQKKQKSRELSLDIKRAMNAPDIN